MNIEESCTNDGARAPDAQGPVVSGGKIHVLGLEAIKTRLGDKWGRMSELVHRYFEAAIRREMAPGDSFAHTSELSYLVLFRGATIAEAQLKCSVVAKEVCKRLFGEDDKDVSVRSLTLPVDDIDLDVVITRESLDELLEKEGNETLFRVGADIESEALDSTAPFRVRLDKHSDHIHSLPRDRPSFLYRPIWDSVRGVVLTYLCQALPATAYSAMTFSDLCVAAEGEEEQAEIDILALKDSLRRAKQLRNDGLRVQFAVPIHFNTLARSRLWREYSTVRHRVASEILKDFAFFIHGIEESVPNIRLVDELPKLSTLSKHLFCLIEEPHSVARQFRNTGISAVGLCYRKGSPERTWMNKLASLSKIARDGGLETFALGSMQRSVAVSAIGAGARYVEGGGVRRPVADPKFVYVHNVESLYQEAPMGRSMVEL